MRILGLLSCLLLPAILDGQSSGGSKPEIPPREREVAMALSAAPAHLRDGAGVYALGPSGFEKVRDSQNGFTCIVNRDHPLNLKPTCYDAEGSATILPKVIQVGAWMMEGKPLTEISQLVADGFKSGRFISPRRPGVAYMLSGDIRNFNQRTNTVGSFPPHVMSYAPNLTNADIGSKGDGSDGLPFIAYQGPHGFMIMMPAPPMGSADSDPVTDAVRAKVPEHEHDTVEAFRIMPEDKYGFRPTPELMTFGELAMHIAGANFYYCRTIAGPDAPRHSLAKTTAPKADLLKVLQESFTFCNGVVRDSHDANLADSLALPGTKDTMTRARILIELVSGMDHHYGQAASYLRLNGLVPPTARAPKEPVFPEGQRP